MTEQEVLLALPRQRSGTLLTHLRCMGQTCITKRDLAQISVLLRLRNPDVEQKEKCIFGNPGIAFEQPISQVLCFLLNFLLQRTFQLPDVFGMSSTLSTHHTEGLMRPVESGFC